MAPAWGAVSVAIRPRPGLNAGASGRCAATARGPDGTEGSDMADVDRGELAGAGAAYTGRETPGRERQAFWPYRWWRIVDFKIGIVPLPIYVALLALIAGFVLADKVPSDILMGMVLLS